jgi:endoglucanase
VVIAVVAATLSTGPAFAQSLRGVNLSGGEFDSRNLPGTYSTHYEYPPIKTMQYFADKGFNTIRMPFRAERVCRTLGGPLHEPDMAQIDKRMDAAKRMGITVVLDMHNYGRWKLGKTSYIIEETDNTVVSKDHFGKCWGLIADRYKAYPNAIFDLMNEPNGQNYDILAEVYQAAVNAIRATGATQPIMLEGGRYSGAHNWDKSSAPWIGRITDKLNNIIYQPHQYLDSNSSGTHESCAVGSGSKRLNKATAWARANGKKLFLGEFAAGPNEQCYTELKALLDHLSEHKDVWIGWTAWGGGTRWKEDYMFRLSPTRDEQDKPQTLILAK